MSSFPEGFVWGVSTAAYQIEGAVHEGGRGPSIWDTYSHTPGKVMRGDTGDVACDHYHRLEEDLDLLKAIGAQVYRFSIAWPRIQPTGKGPANAAGIAFYDRLIDGLIARGIKPVPTLYHWDLPQALEDEGGWANRAIIDWFADYARIVFDAFGDRVDMWTTINEPWVACYLGYALDIHAPGRADQAAAAAAHHHLLLAHAAAVEVSRRSHRQAKVGIALNLMHIYPTSEHRDDVAAAALADSQLNKSFLQPLFAHGYPQDLAWLTDRLQEGGALVRPGGLDRIATPIRFFAINSYHPRHLFAPPRLTETRAAGFDGGYVSPFAFGLPIADVVPATIARTAMGWPVEPDGFRDLLIRLSNDYPYVPLYISENGFSAADYADQQGTVKDPERIAYLASHLRAAQEAIAAGVDLRGYWIWSFLDNFEWAFGYGQRFGLVYVDYPTGRRTPKTSFGWVRDLFAANRLPAL